MALTSRVERGTEDFAPVLDRCRLRWGAKGGIDRIAGVEGGVDNCLALLLGVELGDVVRLVNWVDDPDGSVDSWHRRRLVVIVKDDQLAKLRSRDVRKEVLHRLRVV